MHLEFRIFGIPVRIRVWFMFMAFALGVLHPDVGTSGARLVAWMLVLATAVLAHELGHAVAGKAYGWTPRIELGFIGGATFFERRTQVSRGKRILLVALGPLVGAFLGIVAFATLRLAPPPPDSVAAFTLRQIEMVNLVWGLMNLVPILPLDGGHLVAEVASIFSPAKGRTFAAWLSIALCLAVGSFAAMGKAWTVVLIAGLFAWRNHRFLEVERRGYDAATGIRARDLAYVALTRSDAPAVVEFAQRARDEATKPEESDEATYLLAWGHFLGGDARAARAALDTMTGARDRDFALEGSIAHDLGELDQSLELFERALPRATPFVEQRMIHAIVETKRFDEAVALFGDDLGAGFSPRGIASVQRAAYDAGADLASIGIGERLFSRTADASVAFLVACACSRAGRIEDGFGWLERAREQGFPKPDALDSEPALAALREQPEWGELRASFRRG